jgi:hypothetical protein
MAGLRQRTQVKTAHPTVLIAEHPFRMWESLLAAYGFSPLDTLEVLTFREADLLTKGNELLSFARIMAAVTGLHFYMAATALLWLLTRIRLRNLR